MVRHAEPVFVFADDGLHVFESLAVAGGWIEGIDVENGEYEAIFTVDGHVIQATAEGNWATLTVTGEVDLDGLKWWLRNRSRRSFTSDPDDLRGIANEVLRGEWEARWPKRPRWLDRRLHGDGPPQA